MLQRLRKIYHKFQKNLPANKVRADYFEMLEKLKELEYQVEARASQLENAKSNFLKNLYHEIRTPLNSIIGFTSLLERDNHLENNSKKEYFGLINKSSGEFLKVMDEIIQASLLEAGMINLNDEECNLGDVMEDTHMYCSVRKHLLRKNDIVVIKSTPSKFNDIDIVCDKYYLKQIMNQLLENALKFTEKGVVEYGFNVKNSFIEFFVKDSGKGNLSGKEKFIFSRFTKLDITDSSRCGLGLGLSNCKNLIELMKGKIWYTSNEGSGTCFYFNIPYRTPERLMPVSTENTGELLEGIFRGQNSFAV